MVIYQNAAVSTYGMVILIGLMDRNLFCTSPDLIKALSEPVSPLCAISGTTYTEQHKLIIHTVNQKCLILITAWVSQNASELAPKISKFPDSVRSMHLDPTNTAISKLVCLSPLYNFLCFLPLCKRNSEVASSDLWVPVDKLHGFTDQRVYSWFHYY